MRIVYSADHAKHDPKKEIADGGLIDAVEKPSRAEIVRAHVEAEGLGPIEAPRDSGDDPLLRVHSRDYLSFLRGFWDEWVAAGRSLEAFPLRLAGARTSRRPASAAYRWTPRFLFLRRRIATDRGNVAGCQKFGECGRHGG